MLDEGVQIMRQLWTDRHGHARRQALPGGRRDRRPLPLQEGGIPLWIAGGGEKKTLRIAAKYAQYTNFDATRRRSRTSREILAEHCKEVGTDFDAIVRSANFNVVIGETEKEVADKLAWIRAHYEPLVARRVLERTLLPVRTRARWSVRRSRSSRG